MTNADASFAGTSSHEEEGQLRRDGLELDVVDRIGHERRDRRNRFGVLRLRAAACTALSRVFGIRIAQIPHDVVEAQLLRASRALARG